MKLMPKASAEYVTKRARFVTVNLEGCKKVAGEILDAIVNNQLSIDRFSQNELHPKSDNPEFAVNWIFVCDTLNYCFWKKSDEPQWSVNGQTGYFALCNALNRAIKEDKDILNPAYYSKISDEDLWEILRSDDPDGKIQLFEERGPCLHEVGTVLLQKYNGSFVNCIKKANKSAKALLQLIIEDFPCFRDEAVYNSVHIGIYKRAQILIADIWACFRGEGLGEFTDINDTITMFADYRVPQVLVHFNALEYSPQLLSVLATNVLIRNGCDEEIEIRCLSIYAVEAIKNILLKRLKEEHPNVDTRFVNSILIDHFLWDYRRENAAKLEKISFHKTKSIYY